MFPLAFGSGLPEEIGVEQYKIGSGSLNEFPDLEKIAQTGNP
jgi:sialic acid synthase SpsE